MSPVARAIGPVWSVAAAMLLAAQWPPEGGPRSARARARATALPCARPGPAAALSRSLGPPWRGQKGEGCGSNLTERWLNQTLRYHDMMMI